MESVEFNPYRLTFSGNKVRSFQKLNRFLQPRVNIIGKHHQLGPRRDRAISRFRRWPNNIGVCREVRSRKIGFEQNDNVKFR